MTTGGGTTGAVTFTVTAALAPTLTAISPNSGPRGSSIITPTSEQVTLTGTNFITGATVAVSASGVTVSNVTVVNATTITATFSISSTATLGAHTVRVTTAGGPSNTVNFTVTAEVGGALTFTAATNGTLTGGGILTFTVPAARTPVTSVVTVKNTGAALTILEEEISMNAGLFTISNISCPVAPATLGEWRNLHGWYHVQHACHSPRPTQSWGGSGDQQRHRPERRPASHRTVITDQAYPSGATPSLPRATTTSAAKHKPGRSQQF